MASNVKVEGKYPKKFQRLKDFTEGATLDWAALVESEAKERAPVEKGNMMRSVRHKSPEWDGNRVVVPVGTTRDIDYAKYTEEEQYVGPPGARRKKPRGPSQRVGGRLIYRTKPGATIPWLVPAAEDTEDEGRRMVANAVRRALL